jgi:hypothetical protein
VDDLILPLLAIVNEPALIVDGVDECSQKEAQKVLAVLRKLLVRCQCRIFISCREEINIAQKIPDSVQIRVTPEKAKADMELFIERKVESMQDDRQISDEPEVISYIKQQLLNKADRMSVSPR